MMSKKSELEKILKEQEQLKKDIAVLRKDLSALNSKKRSLIDEIRIKNRNAESNKSKRDRFNSKIQNLKKERTAINERIKSLFDEYKKLKEGAPRKDFKRMEMELKRMEWKLQTSVLKVEKEDALVKAIETLKSELNDFKDLLDLSKEIDAEKLKSKKIHANILSHSKESQTYHEGFLENIQGIRALETEIDTINKNKDEVTSKLEDLKNLSKGKAGEIEELSKAFDSQTKTRHEKSNDELKKEAKLVYEKFKKGEKLSTDDLFLLQRFGQI